MTIQKKLKSIVISVAITGCLGTSLIGLETFSAPSARYQKIANDPSKSGIIAFDKFMIEIYDPLTDEATGEYALYKAPHGNPFSLDILPGFKNFRISTETIDALGNSSSVSIVSIIANGKASSINIPVCVAGEIGTSLNSDLSRYTHIPAYSEQQETLCIPSVLLEKWAVLPGGINKRLASDCYKMSLNTATTQVGILKVKKKIKISCPTL
jgi:hypothetical protein